MTKGAVGNLVNRYRAVLKKCRLMNAFGSLAVAAMLVMGGAAGEAFGNPTGYDVTSPSGAGGTVSGTDSWREADARGINAWATGDYTVPDTITRAEATATGSDTAFSYGVMSQSDTGSQLTVHLGSLDISSKAVLKDGYDYSYSESFGIFNDNNSTVTMKGGSITSSVESQSGTGAAFGIFNRGNSHVTSGADSITVISESKGGNASVQSYGVVFGSPIYNDDYDVIGYTHDTVELTNGKVNINVTSIAQSDGDLYACGLWGKGGEISLNDAEVTVETQTPHQVGYSNTYGVMLEGGSTLKMKDGFIHVTATDSKNEAFTGIATGIQTMSGSGDYKISLGKVDILTKGIEAAGLELSQTMMDMAGGNVEAESLGGQAQGLNATSGTTFTATGDISFTARAEGNKAVALRVEGDSSIMALGGTVTVSGDRTEYDSVGATGLEAHNGGVITKTGGDVTVVSATGVAIGLEAKDNSYSSGEYRASRITYGNADAVTLVNVQGMNAYGIRTWKETDTSDGQSSSVELTNGDIRVSSNGATAMGAYSVSGNIALKGTTAITASAGASGGNVYSLYATSFGREQHD